MRAEERESFAVGGQAVIEGVMMRGRDFVACAVRTPSGEIVLKKEPFRSILARYKLTKVPVLRGAIGLVETMLLGMRILSYSAEVAMPPKEGEGDAARREGGFKEKLGLGLTMVLAFGLGLGLFFYVPLLLTDLTPNAVDDQCFFMGADRQGGGKAAHAVIPRGKRCFFKPHPIADFTPPAALFLFFHPPNRGEPAVCAVFPRQQWNIVFFAVALHFKQPALIFLPRMNVGIVKKRGNAV